jgi:hypothetical protein
MSKIIIWRGIAALAILLIAESAGALTMDQFNTGQMMNSTVKSGHPKLDQMLNDLTRSKNTGAFAEEKGMAMAGDKVRVIIMLADGGDISSLDRFNIIIEERDKNLVQALVPVSALLDIADEPYINFIKVPEKYMPLGGEKSRQASFPSVFSWVAVLVIFLLIKIRRRNKI